MKILISVLVLLISSTAPAQVPGTFAYQGLLTTAAGTPLPDGNYTLQFDLFTVSSGGSSFWTEVDSGIVAVRGTFSVILGAASAFPDSFHRPLYIEVTALSGPSIGSPLIFSPRSSLVSTPYSLSLKMPFTGRAKTGPYGSTLSVYNDSVNGLAFYGRSASPGFANIGAVNGITDGFQANAIYGAAFNGNAAWGVYGTSDSGVGTAGYAWRRNGMGLAGYNNFYGGGIGVYSYGKLRVDAPSGDTSVVLPANSVSSTELLNEPGIARHFTADYKYLTSYTTWTPADSIVITTPSAGYISVEAGGNYYLQHTVGTTSNVYCWIEDTYGGFSYQGLQFGYAGGSLPSDAYYPTFHCDAVYAKAAGTYKFYLVGYNWSGSTVNALGFYWIKATFYPTSYGAVSSIVPSSAASDYKIMNSYAVDPAVRKLEGMANGGRVEINLRELEMKYLKAREEADRAAQEYLGARNAKARSLKNQRPDIHD